MTQEAMIRAKVRTEFTEYTFPQLNIALREIDAMVMDRVAVDPARCEGEQRQYDAECERLLAKNQAAA